jgi:hypothetical protein
MEYLEHRISTQYKNDIADDRSHHDAVETQPDDYTWDPYQQDLSQYPEIFKIYGENYDRYEKAKAKFENEIPGQQMGEPAVTPRKPADQSPWEKKYDDYMPKYTGEAAN